MKRNFLAAVLAILVVFAGRANAQFGVYGQFNGTHDSSISGWYHGFTIGGYDDMAGAGPVHVGFDIRGSYANNSQYHYRSFLFGPRLAVKPPVLPIRPFIQAAVGFGGNRYTGASPINTHYSNKVQYGVIGGLDYTIFPNIDVRLPEIDYIRMSAVSSVPNAPKVNLVGLGFGLVVRLP